MTRTIEIGVLTRPLLRATRVRCDGVDLSSDQYSIDEASGVLTLRLPVMRGQQVAVSHPALCVVAKPDTPRMAQWKRERQGRAKR